MEILGWAKSSGFEWNDMACACAAKDGVAAVWVRSSGYAFFVKTGIRV